MEYDKLLTSRDFSNKIYESLLSNRQFMNTKDLQKNTNLQSYMEKEKTRHKTT